MVRVKREVKHTFSLFAFAHAFPPSSLDGAASLHVAHRLAVGMGEVRRGVWNISAGEAWGAPYVAPCISSLARLWLTLGRGASGVVATLLWGGE